MRDKRSLIHVFMISMLAMISLPIIILGGIFVFGDYYFFHHDRIEIRKAYIQEQETIFKNEVIRAVDYLKWRIAHHEVPVEQLKTEILEWFATIRFQHRGRDPGFIFVGTYDGFYLLGEDQPFAASGQRSWKPGQSGIAAHETFMRAAQNRSGEFVNYFRFHTASRKESVKRAFILGVPDFRWYVGSWFWMDDIDRIIAEKKSTMKKMIQQHVTTVVLVLVAMILFQYLIYRIMMRKIVAGFQSFLYFFKSAEKRDAMVQKGSLHFSEFIELAESADRMMKARNRAETALRESESRYRSIIENIEEGYCEVDVDGNIVFTNEALNEILGYESDELFKMDSKTLLPKEETERILKYFADVYKSEKAPSEYIFPILRKDETQKYIEVSPSVIKNDNDKKSGLRSIVRDVDQRKKYEENLIYLAYHDALTGLKNRKAFYEQLQNAMYHAKRYGTEIGLIYIDIDKFKKVNDTLGHEMGDELLLQIKKRLQSCLRKTDFISRIGGDEFVIIVDNPSKIHPSVIAEKIVEELAKPYDLNGRTVDYVTSSVGISKFPNDAEDMDSLIKKADKAMYKAKEKRNRYFSYSEMSTDAA